VGTQIRVCGECPWFHLLSEDLGYGRCHHRMFEGGCPLPSDPREEYYMEREDPRDELLLVHGGEYTHARDEQGLYRQLVTPRRLRQLMPEHWRTSDCRPQFFGSGDQWDIAAYE